LYAAEGALPTLDATVEAVVLREVAAEEAACDAAL